MTKIVAVATGTLVATVLSGNLYAQSGSSPATPVEETSAGRALDRITFGALDCTGGSTCPGDPLLGTFVTGTYQNARVNFGGDTTLADVSNSLRMLIATQTQTFPSPSTGGGFTFTLKGAPVPVRESELYAPLYGERALTNGAKNLSVTFNINKLRWRSVNGSDVRNSKEGLLWGDTDYDTAGSGYVGVCRMDIATTSFVAAGTYGLAEKFDISLAIPIVHTSVVGSNEFIDFSDSGTSITQITTPGVGGRYYVTGSSTGFGDIGIGAKYSFIRKAEAGAAVAVRTTFPTGSLEDMTGTGESRTSFDFIGSMERGKFSPHVNLGYVVSSGDLFNEFTYNFGTSYGIIPRRVTVAAELIGRRVFGVTTFDSTGDLGVVTSPYTRETFTVRDFQALEEDINLFFVAAGGKVRFTGNWLGSVFFIIPAGSSGMQASRPTLNFGINYAF
jgi:hypothetical protein